MPRSLADGKTKFTILTAKPVNPAAPTATELNAGLELTMKVVADDFSWTAADSDKVGEPALGESSNAQVFGNSNFTAGFTLWRYWLAGGGVDTTNDTAFTALKVKGATLWGYARKTDKLATAVWVAADEIFLGAEFTVDLLQNPGGGGWLKWRVPCEVQVGYPFIAVAA